MTSAHMESLHADPSAWFSCSEEKYTERPTFHSSGSADYLRLHKISCPAAFVVKVDQQFYCPSKNSHFACIWSVMMLRPVSCVYFCKSVSAVSSGMSIHKRQVKPCPMHLLVHFIETWQVPSDGVTSWPTVSQPSTSVTRWWHKSQLLGFPTFPLRSTLNLS